MVGVRRGKYKPYFDNVWLIDRDSFQVSCRFSNLLTTKDCLEVFVILTTRLNFRFCAFIVCFSAYIVHIIEFYCGHELNLKK